MRCVSERKQDTVRKPVKIGRCTFIGTNAVILPGVKVGDHCIIGAGAVVTKDVPSRSVATGVPAKIVGKIALGKKGISVSYK